MVRATIDSALGLWPGIAIGGNIAADNRAGNRQGSHRAIVVASIGVDIGEGKAGKAIEQDDVDADRRWTSSRTTLHFCRS